MLRNTMKLKNKIKRNIIFQKEKQIEIMFQN